MSVADLRDLQRIPSVGPSLAQDLADLGIHCVTDLRRRDPERLYERLCALRGTHIDRCVLYVFRCAVYFASEARHDPERLKWWNWKESKTLRPNSHRGATPKRPIRSQTNRACS
jgi:hypothetical protein